MRIAFLLLIFTLGTPTAHATDFAIGVKAGASSVLVTNDGVSARIILGDRARRDRHGRRDSVRHDRYRDRRGLVPIFVREQKTIRTERAVPPAPPVTVPAPVTVETPPEVLDPAGSARIVIARGTNPRPVPRVGDRIPRGVPYILLDHRRYDLAPPPPGQAYIRHRGAVLRIDQTTRQVIAAAPF